MNARLLAAALVFAAYAAAPEVADACPMCKAASETDDRLPRAFFASILFMLGVPCLLFGGFATAFWRLSRRADEPELFLNAE